MVNWLVNKKTCVTVAYWGPIEYVNRIKMAKMILVAVSFYLNYLAKQQLRLKFLFFNSRLCFVSSLLIPIHLHSVVNVMTVLAIAWAVLVK